MLLPLSELEDTHYGQDIYVLGSGSSLNHVDISFFDDKVTIGVNEIHEYIPTNYTVFHHHDLKINKHTCGKLVIGRHNICDLSQSTANPDMNAYVYEHANQSHMSEVDLSVFDIPNHLACCSTTLATGIHLAYYMGAKNIIVCGADGGLIDGKSHVEGYYKYLTPQNHTHILISWQPMLQIVNEIRRRGVNVVGLNPFINLRLEEHRFDK